MAENYPAAIKLIWDTGQAKPWDYILRNPRAVALVERFVLPRLDRIWVDVEEQADRLAGLRLPLPPIDVVGNTPPISRLDAPRPKRSDGNQVEIVYLGILELQRGFGDLFAAMEILRAKETAVPVRLVIVGAGRDEAIVKAEAARLHLGPDLVEFTGFLPHPMALDRVAAADIGINPIERNEKHDTTLPNKVLDYMAAGLPVVTSDTGPSARLVKSIGCGHVYRSGNPADLVQAILQLSDAATRRELGRRGQEAIRSTYHWERDLGRALAALHEVVQAHRSGHRKANPRPALQPPVSP
jgi:glycosyltransferase involved in cell wall biosynthesis